MIIRVAVAAVAVTLACAPLASADPGFTPDDEFMGLLTDAGVTGLPRPGAISLGHAICDSLRKGDNFDTLTGIAIGGGLSQTYADDLMVASVLAYCPDQQPALDAAAGITPTPTPTAPAPST